MQKVKFFVLGMAALALTFGLVLAGCESSSDGYSASATGPYRGVQFDLNGGGGTPPPTISGVKYGEAITLPGQGDMIAPEGTTFQGWYCEHPWPAGTTYRAGDPVTITSNYVDWVFEARWKANPMVMFDLGEAGGTPPQSMTVEYGTTITLPVVPAPEGKIFRVWYRSDLYGSDQKYSFSAGESVTIYTDCTFEARWTNKKYFREGIYISLISFAGDAALLKSSSYGTDDFVFLDSSGKSSLSSILTNSYRKASESGTALFYGVHKALVNLKANEGEFPTDISSVNMITFTDGLDNASFGASNRDPIEDKTGVTNDAYATYVHGEIENRKINEKPVTAYSVGVKGSDVEDVAQFTTNLNSIASTPTNVKQITDFGELEGVFSGIAEGLTFATHFSMTTTQNNPGTIVRMTFDVTGTTSADAAASLKYIEGTLAYSGGVWTLTNVTYGGGVKSDTSSGGTIIGTVSGSNVSFLFRNIANHDDAATTVQQWTKPSAGSTTWQRNSEYSASGSTSTSTVLVQLVLDASTSLNDTQIGQIRSAVTRFIDNLYDRVSGGNN
jgi:hypothetical protein